MENTTEIPKENKYVRKSTPADERSYKFFEIRVRVFDIIMRIALAAVIVYVMYKMYYM